MERFVLHPENPEKRWMQEIVQILNKDGVIIFPTDSGYSIGCDGNSQKGLKRLYQLKKNEKKYQMTLICQDFSLMTEFAQIDNFAYKYMKSHLPGPYTFILPATQRGRKLLEVKRPSMGIRYPKHIFLNTLHGFQNFVLLSSSAKTENELEPFIYDPDELESFFNGKVDALVDMGAIPSLSTTIISLESGTAECIRLGIGPIH